MVKNKNDLRSKKIQVMVTSKTLKLLEKEANGIPLSIYIGQIIKKYFQNK